MRFPAALAVALLAGCRIPALDLVGKSCPCPDSLVCDDVTNTCVASLADDAARSDGPPDAYRAAVLADEPLAYWRLNDTDATVKDEIGANDGTYNGACTQGVPGALAGDSNAAVAFDGSTCQVTLPNAFPFLDNVPYSVEAWISEASAPAGYAVVVSKETRSPGTAGPIDGYALVESSGGAYFERAVAGHAPVTSPHPLPIGQYVHLVGTYDGATMTMYVDAVAVATRADSDVMPAYDVDMIIGDDLSGNIFTGDIDEVAIYDHVLSADRIALHYQLATQLRD